MREYRILGKSVSSGNHLVALAKISGLFLLLARNFAIKYILFILSYIVPKSENILFFSSVGGHRFPIWKNDATFQFKENPKYLAIYCAKKLKRFVPVFHIPNRKRFSQIEKLGIRPTKGLRAFWYMLRARYLFVDNNNFFNPNASFLVGNFKIIQCWHGTPIKNVKRAKKTRSTIRNLMDIAMKAEYKKYEYFISACEHGSEAYKLLYGDVKVEMLGQPRNDILFDREFFAIENLSNLSEMGRFSKILLYAPTYRKAEESVNPFDGEFVERINETLKSKDYLLLIKQHPYAKGISFDHDYSNIKDVSDKIDDIQELLVNIDVLICDYSSVMFDFALTERLQLFYPFDLKEYEISHGGVYFDYNEKNLPGLIIKDKDDFIRKMEQLEVLMEDKDTKDRMEEFKKKYNQYTDGDSCKRLFEFFNLTSDN
jgi:CDP-glycerol glycerophosphotransferase